MLISLGMAVSALPETQDAGQTLTLINAAVVGTLAYATYVDVNGSQEWDFNAMVRCGIVGISPVETPHGRSFGTDWRWWV